MVSLKGAPRVERFPLPERELFEVFGGRTLAPGLHEGFYQDPDTGEKVGDRSYKYTVAVRRSSLKQLRTLLSEACGVFAQKSIYLSVAGQFEFIEARREEMSLDDRYVDLKGRELSLARLDADERALLKSLEQRADRAPSWHEFANFWMKLVGEFYHGRGLSRSQVRDTTLYRIAQDLASRLAVEQGVARVPDYRDEIETLVRTRYKAVRY